MNDSVQVPQQNKRGPGISLQSVRRELRKLAWLSVGMTLLTLALIFTLLALLNTEEGHREVIQMQLGNLCVHNVSLVNTQTGTGNKK